MMEVMHSRVSQSYHGLMQRTPWRQLWREMKPVEHGAWGLFIIPLALGAFVGRGGLLGHVLLGTSTLGVFLMRRPALVWLRACNRESLDAIHTLWPSQAFTACFVLTLAAGIPLVLMGHFYLIFVSALAAALIWSEVYLAGDRQRHSFLSELIEVWVLSLLAPSAYYVGTGRIDQVAAVLWTLCAIYFSVTIADIRVRLAYFRVRRGLAAESLVNERKTERLVACWVSLAGALLVAVLAPAFLKSLGSLSPLFVRPFFRQGTASGAGDISRLGWSEVYLSLLFAGLAAWLL
jgi:hypothetical protein